MSSELQLDVRHVNRWRRHLVNTYEVKAGMVFIAGKTVWSMPECFKVICIPCKAQIQVLCFTFYLYLIPFQSYRSLLFKFWTLLFEPTFGGLGKTSGHIILSFCHKSPVRQTDRQNSYCSTASAFHAAW